MDTDTCGDARPFLMLWIKLTLLQTKAYMMPIKTQSRTVEQQPQTGSHAHARMISTRPGLPLVHEPLTHAHEPDVLRADQELRSNVILHLYMQLTNLKTHSTNTCNVLTN